MGDIMELEALREEIDEIGAAIEAKNPDFDSTQPLATWRYAIDSMPIGNIDLAPINAALDAGIGLFAPKPYFAIASLNGTDATATHWRLDKSVLREREINLGYIEQPDLVGYYRERFTDISDMSLYNGNKFNIPLSFSTIRGDYYKIVSSLNGASAAQMSVEIIGLKWDEELSAQDRDLLKDYIRVNHFLQGGTAAESGQSALFQWNSVTGDYKDNIVVAQDIPISGNAALFYYIQLLSDFPTAFKGKLFSIDTVKITIY